MVTLKVKKVGEVQTEDSKGNMTNRVEVIMSGKQNGLKYTLKVSAPRMDDLHNENFPTILRTEQVLELKNANHEITDYVPSIQGEPGIHPLKMPTRYVNGVLKP